MGVGVEVSLIIATRNRSALLAQSLRSLLALPARPSWELIVVDNGSTDDTQSVLDDFGCEFAQPLRRVFESRRGLGNAHNAGWRAARGQLIAFSDDDCYPATDYLAEVVNCFSEKPCVGFVGGRVLLHDENDYRISIRESTDRIDLPAGSFIVAGMILGANFACRRPAIETVNGFDPWFGPGAKYNAEEVDLLARLLAAGWDGAYDPRPVVYHHHRRRTNREARRLMTSYDYGRGAYYAKSILDRRLRAIYLKNWCKEIGRQDVAVTIRELVAGTSFLLRAMIDQGRRFPGGRKS
jgi:glycosyltransferase involved in cell wall biosynthesis